MLVPSAEKITLNGTGYNGNLKVYSEFQNLKELDISGSSISLDLNGCESLVSLNMNNVKLGENGTISVINHKIKNIYFDNITAATVTLSNLPVDDVTIQPAQKIGTLNISGNGKGCLKAQSNTTSKITFSSYETVEITGENVSEIYCNDSEETSVLRKVKIIECPKLTTLSLSAKDLEELDLHDCVSLKTLELKKSGDFKLKTLDLSGTQVNEIIIKDYKDEKIPTQDGCLDLSIFKSLCTDGGYFKIRGNSAVSHIQFKNEQSSPVELKYNFNGCSSLERVYGNIAINCTDCFNGCNKFSIHGEISE